MGLGAKPALLIPQPGLMRRILLTVHKFFPGHRAGTEVLTLKVAQELMRRGCDVLVVAANPPDRDARHASGPETSEYVFEGVPVHVVEEPLRLKSYTFRHEYWHSGIASHFEKVLDSFKPDIVHVFHAQNLSAAIIDAARRRDLPVVFSAMDFWFVCPVVQLRRPDGAICKGPAHPAINCLTCYTPQLFPPVSEFAEAVQKKYRFIGDVTKAVGDPLKSLAIKCLYGAYIAGKVPAAARATIERPNILRDIANRMQAIMVPTRVMREIFIAGGIRPELIEHVPFGIDTAPLAPYQAKQPSDLLRIGYIGTMFEHKGVDLLIEAFQQLPAGAQATLTMYGDPAQFPEYGARLKAMADRPCANSSKIRFAGTFPNAELGNVMANLDVLVVPSRWYENTPLVIQSALATKTPVIATDLGGMSELVKHEVNGLLFRLNDPSSLQEQLQRVLDDRSLLGRFRQNIPPERTVEEMVDDIESVYRRVEGQGGDAQNEGDSPNSRELRGTMTG